jgi:TetR/AcrR family tetracycline transcriptional repressor
MGRPSKPLISPSLVVKEALRIIDEEGLEELSIRRLGRELNVQGISLYHHFKNKDEILAGACALALSQVRTPRNCDTNWREWLLQNAIEYRKALQQHPNLIPVLMRRHPLRIGLKEHNATAGLLAVQGVRGEAIMPLVEALEELALGSASYQSAVDNDEHTEHWREHYPYLYILSRKSVLSKDRIFELIARAAIEAISDEVEGMEPARDAALVALEVRSRAAAEVAPKAEPRRKTEARIGAGGPRKARRRVPAGG